MILNILGTAFLFVCFLFLVMLLCALIYEVHISKQDKDYGNCGIIRHHKVIKNKNGQYTCKYCGKTKLTLENELKNKNLKGKK